MSQTSPKADHITIASGSNQTNTRTQTAAKANKTSIASAQAAVMPPPKPVSHQTEQPSPNTIDQNLLSKGGSMTVPAGQQPTAGNTGMIRKSNIGISDGNETDSSVGSSSSKKTLRPRPGKKPRVEEDQRNKWEGEPEAN